jgi:hypothetical protein
MADRYVNAEEYKKFTSYEAELDENIPLRANEYNDIITRMKGSLFVSGHAEVYETDKPGKDEDGNDYPNRTDNSIDLKALQSKALAKAEERIKFHNLQNGFVRWVTVPSSTQPEQGKEGLINASQAKIIFTTYHKGHHDGFFSGFNIEGVSTFGGIDSTAIMVAGVQVNREAEPPEVHLAKFWSQGHGQKLLDEFEEEQNIDNAVSQAVHNAQATGKNLSEEELKDVKKKAYAEGVDAAGQDRAFKENLPEEEVSQKEEWWAAHKQCILLGGLEKVSDFSKKYRQKIIAAKRLPYRGRIVPIESKYTERFMNEMMMSENANMYLGPYYNADWYGPVIPKLRLSLVKEEEAGLREYDITSLGGSTLMTEACVLSSDPNRKTNKLKNPKLLNSHVAIESFTYSMNGSDPSTARKDIQAELKIRLTSVDWIAHELNVESLNPKDGTTELVPFRVVDLLLYPDDYKNAKGYGKVYRNQYHPSYNRLTAVLYNVFSPGEKKRMIRANSKKASNGASQKWFDDLETSFKDSAMILNLALIDHQFDINKSSDDMSVILTIKYAGYFETALNAPYMDALADKGIMQNRKERQEKLKEAMDEKCPITYVQTMEQDNQAMQIAEAKMSRRKIVDRLIKRRKLWMTEFDRSAIAKYVIATRGVPSDPQEVWETAKVDPENPQLVKENTADESDALASTTAQSFDAIQNAAKDEKSVSKLYYFFLGDLFEILTDCVYQQEPGDVSKDPQGVLGSKERDTNTDDLKWMKLYFAASSFKYKKMFKRKYADAKYEELDDLTETAARAAGSKNYEFTFEEDTAKQQEAEMKLATSGENTYSINILDVPIALDFFKKWFEQTVIKKERNFYPAMSMIRDLVEKVVTNLLNEVCFGSGVGQKLRFKVTVGSTAELKGDSSIDPLFNEYITQGGSVLSLAKSKNLPMLKHDPSLRTKDYTNYIIIYCQQHNVFDAGVFGGDFTKHYKNYVPHFHIGRNTDGSVISADFKRSEVKYLREARYFSGNGANLAQLQNVYAVNGMKLQHNTYMFPGMLTWMEFNSLRTCGGSPAKMNSLAYQLGLGGYHMITKVNGSWKPSNDGSTTVDAVWTHSGAPEDIRRFESKKGKSIQQAPASPACQTLLDDSAQELEDLENKAENQLEAEQKIEEEQQEAQSTNNDSEVTDPNAKAMIGGGEGTAATTDVFDVDF